MAPSPQLDKIRAEKSRVESDRGPRLKWEGPGRMTSFRAQLGRLQEQEGCGKGPDRDSQAKAWVKGRSGKVQANGRMARK